MNARNHQGLGLNPILARGGPGGAMSSRMAWNRLRMLSSCIAILRSSSANLAASSAFMETIRRNRTKARMIAMLTRTAPSAAQRAREHRDALLGEDAWEVLGVAPFL